MAGLILLRPTAIFGAFTDRWKHFIGIGLGFLSIGIKACIIEGGPDYIRIDPVGQILKLYLSL